MEDEEASAPPVDDDEEAGVVVVAMLVGTAVRGTVALPVAVASLIPAPRKLALVPRVIVSGVAVADADVADVGVGVSVRRPSLAKGREAVMVVPNLPLSRSMPSVRESESWLFWLAAPASTVVDEGGSMTVVVVVTVGPGAARPA